jgi:hypothetical protein
MSRDADDCTPADDTSRVGDREVVLPHMNAGGAA